MPEHAHGHFTVSDRISIADPRPGPVMNTASRRDHYPIHVTADEQETVTRLVAELDGRRVALVTDDTVLELHAARLADALRERGVPVVLASFPAGEASKSVATAVRLLDWLAGTAVCRRDVVLAVGGGVVTDTVGWVASAYMRGVPYMNVPTTLLGAVDASLGGKVAVNHDTAKNLIGAFYQPKAVVSNVGYLDTLDDRQLRSGLAEAVKKGIIASPELFKLIERSHAHIVARDPASLRRLVHGATMVKSRLTERDPYEIDLARPLNLGHTVGHALETVTGYGPVLHGEAVALGIVTASLISHRRGLLSQASLERIIDLIGGIGLPSALSQLPVGVDASAVVASLAQIRKIRDGSLRFVLPTRLGEVVIAEDVSEAEIRFSLSTPLHELAGSQR